MSMTNIVCADNARQLARCLKHETVIKHLYLNFRALNTVIAMANRVYDHLLYHKLWIFTVCFEDAVLSKIGMLLYLRFKIFYRFLYLFKNTTIESNIFDDIHFTPDLFLSTKVFDKADSCTRKECLRMLAKKQYTSSTDLWDIAFIDHKTLILLQIFHCRLAITNPFHVGFNCIHVYVIKRGIICCRILIVAFSFVVHKL